MTVKTQRVIKLENKCGCRYDEDILVMAMIWYAERPQCSKKTVFMHGNYPAVSIHDKKIHVHRLVALYLNRDKLISSLYAHHKDGDKLNALPSNLEMVDPSSHQSHHNKGKTLSASHKNKISLANKKRRGTKIKRKYNIPLDELRDFLLRNVSINSIAKHYGCNWSVVKQRIDEDKELLK